MYQQMPLTAASSTVCSRMFIVFLLRMAPAQSMAKPACMMKTRAPAKVRKKVLTPSFTAARLVARLTEPAVEGGGRPKVCCGMRGPMPQALGKAAGVKGRRKSGWRGTRRGGPASVRVQQDREESCAEG
jgi:hypothetical protein